MKIDAQRFVRCLPALAVAALCLPCSTVNAAGPVPESNLEMAATLRRIVEAPGFVSNQYVNSRRAEKVLEELKTTTDPRARFQLQKEYAVERLNAGDTRDAIRELEVADEMMRGLPQPAELNDRLSLRSLRGIAQFRLGEQINCITNHTIDSCIVPIRPGGFHDWEDGAREAIRLFSEQLTEAPHEVEALWLLNVAYMAVGGYPDEVPPKWLVDPKRFESDYDIGRFPDAAPSLGVDLNQRAGGTVLEDFNNDGRLDIMVSGYSLNDPIEVFFSQPDGTFKRATKEAWLEGLTGAINLVQGDYNNDGFVDVFALRGGWMFETGNIPNSLLRNNGDGTFTDVTREAGLGGFRPSHSAAWLDFDGDGLLDIFVGNETYGRDRHRSELFRNNGDGTFTEIGLRSGIRVFRYVKGVVAGDYNNDGRPDLYLSCAFGPNLLFRNDGPAKGTTDGEFRGWTFTDVTAEAGVAEPNQSFPTWFFDYDNDGHEDLFVASYDLRSHFESMREELGLPNNTEPLRMYRNNGDGTFADVAGKMKVSRALLAMGSNFGDLDNDGWLDFYVGTGNPDLRSIVPNHMYRNAGGEFFQNVTTSGGFGHLQKGHGVAFGDLDNDGDQDVFANMGGAYEGDGFRNALFLNPGHGNHWIGLKLEGRKANRGAIGTRIRVDVTGPERDRSIHRTVGSGGSFGASPLRQHIGLGRAETIKRIEITWAGSGTRQVFTDNLELNRYYTLAEGDVAPKPADWERLEFTIDEVPADHHHGLH